MKASFCKPSAAFLWLGRSDNGAESEPELRAWENVKGGMCGEKHCLPWRHSRVCSVSSLRASLFWAFFVYINWIVFYYWYQPHILHSFFFCFGPSSRKSLCITCFMTCYSVILFLLELLYLELDDLNWNSPNSDLFPHCLCESLIFCMFQRHSLLLICCPDTEPAELIIPLDKHIQTVAAPFEAVNTLFPLLLTSF